MESQRRSYILEQVTQGELSVDQALSALEDPKSMVRRDAEREWFPLWLRIVISEGGGKGFRLRIPLFVIVPVALALFLLFLPFVVIALAIVQVKFRKPVLHYALQFIVPISMAMVQLCFCGRGAGVEVIDGDDEVIVRLE